MSSGRREWQREAGTRPGCRFGDFLNFGEKKYGEKYEQAVNDFGMKYETCRKYANVANSFQMSRRRDNLSWNHHAAVASVPSVKEQDALLKKAEKEELSVSELRNIVRQKKIEKDRQKTPNPTRNPARAARAAERIIQ